MSVPGRRSPLLLSPMDGRSCCRVVSDYSHVSGEVKRSRPKATAPYGWVVAIRCTVPNPTDQFDTSLTPRNRYSVGSTITAVVFKYLDLQRRGYEE